MRHVINAFTVSTQEKRVGFEGSVSSDKDSGNVKARVFDVLHTIKEREFASWLNTAEWVAEQLGGWRLP